MPRYRNRYRGLRLPLDLVALSIKWQYPLQPISLGAVPITSGWPLRFFSYCSSLSPPLPPPLPVCLRVFTLRTAKYNLTSKLFAQSC